VRVRVANSRGKTPDTGYERTRSSVTNQPDIRRPGRACISAPNWNVITLREFVIWMRSIDDGRRAAQAYRHSCPDTQLKRRTVTR
jgi:hypothetical protein